MLKRRERSLIPTLVSSSILSLLLAACGPTLSTQIRLETSRAPGNTGSETKEGLTIEVPEVKTMPEQFKIDAPACDQNGVTLIDEATKAPQQVTVVALPIGGELDLLKITNQTDHVIRLQGAVIRLFDPAENPIEPMSKEEIVAAARRSSNLAKQGACPEAGDRVSDALASVKFFGPNTELLPGTTTSGFLLFMPPTNQSPGTWKLSLYEIPVKVDAAGAATAKTRFDFAYTRKKIRDTYSQELMGQKTLVKSEEVP